MRTLHLAPALLFFAPMACTKEPGTGDASSGAGTSSGDSSTGGSSGVEPTTGVPTGSSEGSGSSSTGSGVADCSGDSPRVRMETSLGDMVIELDAVNAPNTTANFLEYVEAGFYDGTIFHRVIDGFVIQGGGFTGDLTEKPTDPPIELEISPALKHVDGAIAMARTSDPNSATSQFYLCDGPQEALDGAYAAFGVLVEGAEVLAAISAVAVHTEAGYADVPVEDVFVTLAYCVP